jgi:hypothetical protein
MLSGSRRTLLRDKRSVSDFASRGLSESQHSDAQ